MKKPDHPSQEQITNDVSRCLRTMATCNHLNKFVPAIWALKVLADSTACPTACTDGFSIWINPAFWNSLTHAQQIGLLLHEALHCMLLHPKRFKHAANHRAYNIAADYRINGIIRELSKLTALIALPDDGLDDEGKYANEAEEVVYNILVNEESKAEPEEEQSGPSCPNSEPGDTESGQEPDKEESNGEGEPSPEGGQEPGGAGGDDDTEQKSGGWSPGDFLPEPDAAPEAGPAGEEDSPSSDTKPQLPKQQDFEEKWTEIANQVKQASKLSGMDEGLAERLTAGEAGIEWKSLLSQFIRGLSFDDISMDTFDRRFLSDGLYLESFERPRMRTAVAARDCSLSVSSDMVANIGAEVRQAMMDVGIERVVFIDFSTRVGDVHDCACEEDIPSYTKVRGGTDFRPVFEWIEDNDLVHPDEVECLLFFTDGYGPFPDQAPNYPVLFLDFGGTDYPFGDVIDLRKAIIN